MHLFSKCPRSSIALIAGIALFIPGFADAQIFFATRPEPPFAIGPLMIRARVDEGVTTVTINVLWSVVIPTALRPADVQQDLYLAWPGEMEPDPGLGTPDPAL